MIVKRKMPGWFFSDDAADVRTAIDIGLPLMSHCTNGLQHSSVCLPICYRKIYEELASIHGITIEWQE